MVAKKVYNKAYVQSVLAERADELKIKQKKKDPVDSINYFIFRIGNDLFAFKMGDINEIREEESIIPIPCTVSFIIGVINLHGEIISVLDIRDYINVSENVKYHSKHSRIIIIKSDVFIGSILVSEVIEKVVVKKTELMEITEYTKNASNFISQTFLYKKDLVSIVDIKRLLRKEEFIINHPIG